jgi:glycine cleavage system H protein
MSEAEPYVRYRRARFSTRLHTQRLYTAAHQWLWEKEQGLWCVGFTKFALRMLGDPVEFEFEVQPGAPIERGQTLGWIEGLKAVTDVFSPLDGNFAGPNPELEDDITLLVSARYENGWLFAARGIPNPGFLDASGYASFLDQTIERMTGSSE